MDTLKPDDDSVSENVEDNAERINLENRCNEVMGNKNPVLAKVLSYFPDEAKLFIQIQEHAFQVTGKRDNHYAVQHRTDNSPDFSGKERYSKGVWEYLGEENSTWKLLTGQINQILGLRNNDGKNYLPKKEVIESIIEVIEVYESEMTRGQIDSVLNRSLNKQDIMTLKLLEVMEITPQEIKILKVYIEYLKNASLAREDSKHLRDKATALRKEADEIEEKAKDVAKTIKILTDQAMIELLRISKHERWKT